MVEETTTLKTKAKVSVLEGHSTQIRGTFLGASQSPKYDNLFHEVHSKKVRTPLRQI